MDHEFSGQLSLCDDQKMLLVVHKHNIFSVKDCGKFHFLLAFNLVILKFIHQL